MWKLANDTLDQEDLDALARWLGTGPRLTQGPMVAEFEQAWSSWLGAEHTVMVTSGTMANFALLAALSHRLAPKRLRIGVSAVTWSTNVTPSIFLNHEITVFDIDPRTLGVRATDVCEAMEAGLIDVLFVTHLLGFCALDSAILECADRNNVLLIEDCCESHGARYGMQKVGTVGLASTFSFYFGHHMSTIEGGMVSTDDAEVADLLRLMRAHGMARESTRFQEYARRHPDIDPRFLFLVPGLNFRSTELNAFLGLRQLEGLDDRVQQRNRNMEQFLAELPDWLYSDFATDGMSSFALPLIAQDERGASAVREVVDALGIESRPVVAGNLLRQPFLQNCDATPFRDAAPVADHVHDFGLYVGNGHHVSPTMIRELTSRLGSRTPA